MFVETWSVEVEMVLVQIKVVYDYYSSKRTTLFFVTEEELLNKDFQDFKNLLLREVPHLSKSTSAASLRLTVNDEDMEVDLSPMYFNFQIKEMVSKQKNITVKAFSFESPSLSAKKESEESSTDEPVSDLKNLPNKRNLLTSTKAKKSLDLQKHSKCGDSKQISLF